MGPFLSQTQVSWSKLATPGGEHAVSRTTGTLIALIIFPQVTWLLVQPTRPILTIHPTSQEVRANEGGVSRYGCTLH